MRCSSMLAAALTAGLALPQAAAAAEDLAQEIHDWVIENLPGYGTLPESKVLVGCVEWDPPDGRRALIHMVFVTYSGRTSDRPIFMPRLESDALHRCNRWRKAEKADCTCQTIDKDGKNLLKVPR